ncbi:MAG TPA: DNA polymerase, partial [Terriglobales bacterium]|nr:DNA polymerase [Terriglobales bacterium]
MPPRKTSSLKQSEEPSPNPGPVPVPAGLKDRVFLIDTMSFIFRAYHAMARQRPMSTKTGLPTAAILVFVNMLRKLREDFSPEYLAAVFDVGGKTFRDTEAEAITTVRKFDLKTQSFQEIQYHGYKANRSEMPEDLVQQVPYIRRALEAYRIPILEQKGFEADDLIGTLARKAAAESYLVYVVSSDKDMLQLVTDKVLVLNPPKDNLIADAAKVEEILGVPPERVVDVMALRGDSIDNIPGAPGIGDKGSVELIKRFGSVEQALDHAAEIEKKTYRESLLNNREIVMFSKRMATIDCNVPVDLDLTAMKAGEPDLETLRALFSELEFTSLLKELLPVVEVTEAQYGEAKTPAEVEVVLKRLPSGGSLTIAIEAVSVASDEETVTEESEPEEGMLPFQLASPVAPTPPVTRNIAISAGSGAAIVVPLNSDAGSKLKSVLANERMPKTVHDYKAALHALNTAAIELSGVQHDTRLYSYLLDPTYSSHGLPAVALRRLNLKLSGNLAESADVTGRLATTLAEEVEKGGLKKTYDEIDLPLVPVLARMEEAGVKIDTEALARMSTRLESEIDAKAKEIYECCGQEFNINSPRQLGEVLFNRLNLPKPVKYGKGKTISTAVDVLEGLAAEHQAPRLVLEYRQLSKLKSTYVDTLP